MNMYESWRGLQMVAYQLWMQKKHVLCCEQVPAVLWGDALTGSRAVLGADTHCCGAPHAYGDPHQEDDACPASFGTVA